MESPYHAALGDHRSVDVMVARARPHLFIPASNDLAQLAHPRSCDLLLFARARSRDISRYEQSPEIANNLAYLPCVVLQFIPEILIEVKDLAPFKLPEVDIRQV